MKKNYFGLPLIIAAILLSTTVNLQAQVTVGSEIPPTRAALLELKTQQLTLSPGNGATHPNNATSTAGGLLLPRVMLVSTNTMDPFIDSATDPEWNDATQGPILRAKLTGLTVYNLTDDNSTLYPGLWTWNGARWITSQPNTNIALFISAQPKAFTFYELGTESGTEVAPLTFTISGGIGPFSYQWYRITSNNVHVNVGEPLTSTWGAGYNTASYTPTRVLKGTTRNADNTGFYRFYCVVTDNATNISLTSDVAEVAVGCGGKTKEGKWLSFMCFNLGADNTSTINSQKTYSITFDPPNDATTGLHTYVNGEENVYGDLFQWGRIVDGHEDRQSVGVAYGSLDASELASGGWCSDTDTQRRPVNQIKKSSTTWYGKFITGRSNWNPIVSTSQASADGLWAAGRYLPNDPCTHYKNDGSYHEFWHETTPLPASGDAACGSSPDNWRLPTQAEWGELYRGGTIFGSPANAEANTWFWNGTSGPRGYEIRPDNVTTTLFLPASGIRNYSSGYLYYQGSDGNYWSSSVVGVNAYSLLIRGGSINPASNNLRSSGFALRCTKHQ